MIHFLLLLVAGCEGVINDSTPETRCVFQSRNLKCDILVENNDEYSCTVCPYSGSKNKPCPARNDRHSDCNVDQGVCSYHCDTMIDCLEKHWLIFDKLSTSSNETDTSCKVVQTQQLVKPEAVRDLTLTPINSTAVEVKFSKPTTGRELFKYIVKYTSTNSEFSGKRKLRTRSDHQVAITLGDLQPGQNYTISVFARPRSKGYRSAAQARWIVTTEDVPISGPGVPEGAFIVNNNHIILYWKKLPLKERRGRIRHYMVSINQCGHQTIASHDQYWTVVSLTSCSREPLEVTTSANTSVGWSKHPSVFHVNTHLYKANHVVNVYKKTDELVWSFPRNKLIDSFSVFSCYGNTDQISPQIIDCKVPVENITVSAKKRSMALVERDAPEIGCSLCEWHYGVSVNVAGSGAGITWNVVSLEKVSESDSGLLNITVIITVVTVVVIILVVLFVVLVYKHKNLCKNIFIVLPEGPSFNFLKEETSVSHLSSSKPDTVDKPPNHYYRDSGTSSMTTLRHDQEETKRLTSMTEEDKDVELEDRSCPADEWTENQGEEGMWSSTDNSAMSDYRQVAGSQEELEPNPDIATVIYGSGSDCECDSSVPDTSVPSTDISAPTIDTSAPTIDTSAPTIDTSIPSTNMSVPTTHKSIPSTNISTPTIDTSAPTTHTSAPTKCTSAPSTLSSAVRDVSSGTSPSASGKDAMPLQKHCNVTSSILEENVGLDPSSRQGPVSASVSENLGEILSGRSSTGGDITRETDICDEKVPFIRVRDPGVMLDKDKSSHTCDENNTETSIGSYAEFHCDAI